MNLAITPVTFKARIIIGSELKEKDSSKIPTQLTKVDNKAKTTKKSLYKYLVKRFVYPKIAVKLKVPS